jgi:hypothetical protein
MRRKQVQTPEGSTLTLTLTPTAGKLKVGIEAWKQQGQGKLEIIGLQLQDMEATCLPTATL